MNGMAKAWPCRWPISRQPCNIPTMGYERGGFLAEPDSEVALHDLPTEALVTAISNAFHERLTYQVVIGRLAAELHRRAPGEWTFYKLAEVTHVPRSSLHRWARPYLQGGEPA